MRWVLSPILGDGKPARRPYVDDETGPYRPVAGLIVGGAIDHLGRLLEGPGWSRSHLRFGP